jgi:hypothetical protein
VSVVSRESVDRAVQDLEAAVERAQPILTASVGRISHSVQQGNRWIVAVSVNDGVAFRPRFTSWLDANEFRTAAFEIIDAAT